MTFMLVLGVLLLLGVSALAGRIVGGTVMMLLCTLASIAGWVIIIFGTLYVVSAASAILGGH